MIARTIVLLLFFGVLQPVESFASQGTPSKVAQKLETRSPRPYFLRRSLSEVEEELADISTDSAHYRPMYGEGDTGPRILRGVVRFAELTVDPGGSSSLVSYPEEEQIYFVLEGRGALLYDTLEVPLRENDFVYLPPRVRHGVSNQGKVPCRLLIMGYHIPGDMAIQPTPELLKSNLDEVPVEPTHGRGSKFKLLLGDKGSTRDKLAAAHVVTSLFHMEFDPGVDNFPHAHDMEEEIYFVLRGKGEVATGAGPNATEGRYPVEAGDAFFFRLNATVGFYRGEGEENPEILAVRSRYPFRKVKGTWSPMELIPVPKRQP
jgi:mannose-6-phosphate isomerase-like protein (cupin superfamily)